jgi:hypothetical protein
LEATDLVQLAHFKHEITEMEEEDLLESYGESMSVLCRGPVFFLYHSYILFQINDWQKKTRLENIWLSNPCSTSGIIKPFLSRARW